MALFWVLDLKVLELFRISDFGFSASDLSILISNFKFLWPVNGVCQNRDAGASRFGLPKP